MKEVRTIINDYDLYTHLKSDEVFNVVYNSAIKYALSTSEIQFIFIYNDEIIFDNNVYKESDLICTITNK